MSDNNSCSLTKVDSFNEVLKYLKAYFRDEDYHPDYFLATTFGLEMNTLNSVLRALNITNIGTESGVKADVFYDWHNAEEIANSCIGLECLHPVWLERKAFHPKLILVRYISSDKKSDKKQVRYGAVVSSRNLTNSDLIDDFVVMTSQSIGLVTAPADENEQSDAKNNNQYSLSDFVIKLFQDAGCKERDELKELKSAKFSLLSDNDSSNITVEFADAAALDKIIKPFMTNNEELLVCSPFVSYSTKERRNNITIITGANESYIRNANRITPNVYSYMGDQGSLHAKLYCFLEKGNDKMYSVIVIGSSNFTNNGLGKNSELNCIIKIPDEGKRFNELKKYLINMGWRVFLNDDQCKPDPENQKASDLPSEFYEYLKDNNQISVKYKNENWHVRLSADTSKYRLDKKDYAIIVSRSDMNKGMASISIDYPGSIPTELKFKFEGDPDRVYSFSLSSIASLPKEYDDEFNKMIKDNQSRNTAETIKEIWSIPNNNKKNALNPGIFRQSEIENTNTMYTQKKPNLYEIIKLKRAQLAFYSDCDKRMLDLIKDTLSAVPGSEEKQRKFFESIKTDIEKKLKIKEK